MTTITAKFHVASSDKKNTLPAAAYPKHATNQLPQATAPELRRIPLPRLSEKGYEQRSEREFGRAGRQKWVEKCRFGAL
jgi:hypothetical protein